VATITTVEELEAIYGPANRRSITKEIPYLNEDYRAFFEAAPLVILASVGTEGLDCSPKGGWPRICADHGCVNARDPEAAWQQPDRPSAQYHNA
jgi:predicted pyridoxine 5'-phosphate oxidase superfamily flavin-nucleotide-binding protein